MARPTGPCAPRRCRRQVFAGSLLRQRQDSSTRVPGTLALGGGLARRSRQPGLVARPCAWRNGEKKHSGGELDTCAQGEAGGSQLEARVHNSIHEVDREQWNGLVRTDNEVNPFLLWEFFAALEDSKSAAPSQGWLPHHLSIRDSSDGGLVALVPMYLKGHSYGEYVFDHSWANLHGQLGVRYYPKLQACVPFTPVPGPRILVSPTEDSTQVRRTVFQVVQQIVQQAKVSSAHMTFNLPEEWKEAGAVTGWKNRIGLQYHWCNHGYDSFDSFLAVLKQRRRRSIRQERNSIAKQGLTIRRLRGDEVTPAIWDLFFECYQDTTDRKWGSAYLTRDFFHRLGATMGESVLLMAAYDDNRNGEMVAAALNLVGSDALFGRNWGCRGRKFYKNLHFELCYYQAIEAAIEMGLSRVEAGAQGEHKISRGYMPTATYSSHFVQDPRASQLIKQFLQQEAAEMECVIEALRKDVSPFRDDIHDLEAAVKDMTQLQASQCEQLR